MRGPEGGRKKGKRYFLSAGIFLFLPDASFGKTKVAGNWKRCAEITCGDTYWKV